MLVVNSAIGCFKFYSPVSSNKHLILSGLMTFNNILYTPYSVFDTLPFILLFIPKQC